MNVKKTLWEPLINSKRLTFAQQFNGLCAEGGDGSDGFIDSSIVDAVIRDVILKHCGVDIRYVIALTTFLCWTI